MKIVIHAINFAPDLTGTGKYTGELAFWLSSRGHEIRVVTAPPYYPQWKVDGRRGYYREIMNGIYVWRCPLYVPSKPTGLKRILHQATFAIFSVPVMLRQILWRPDIVLVIEPALLCLPSALMVASLSGAKSWLHIQDFEIDAAFSMGLVRSKGLKYFLLEFERCLMDCFSMVSTISKKMLHLVVAKGVAYEKTTLFPNWVDTSIIRPMLNRAVINSNAGEEGYRAKLGISKNDIIALYSGNMGEKQGLEIIIEAAHIFLNSKNIHFLFCGDGTAYSRLRASAEGINNIHWIPLQPYEKLNELLNVADIHLLPQVASIADLVMPSKLTGIFASGRPVVVVAEQGTSLSDVVKASGGGLTVLPGDVDGLVSALSILIENPETRNQMGQSARNYAVKYLDINLILLNFEKTLKTL